MLTVGLDRVRLTLRVQPRAARTRVVGRHGDALKVQVAAPPVEGAANEAVIDCLAAWLDVPRRAITIARGTTGRDKLVDIATPDPTALARRITDRIGSL